MSMSVLIDIITGSNQPFQNDGYDYDANFDLRCASFCIALCLLQCNSFKQHKMNQLVRKKKKNNKDNQSILLIF